ncbi:MAG: hypothetical protein ACRD12_24780 [Acidimicrobiales bacterium]
MPDLPHHVAYDPGSLGRYLAGIEAECVRLRDQIAAQRARIGRTETVKNDHVAAERGHRQVLEAIEAAATAEVTRLLTHAEEQAAAIRTAAASMRR